MSRFGTTEILLILVVVVVLFGYKKLPEIGKGLGHALKNFKRSLNEPDEIDITDRAKDDAPSGKNDKDQPKS